MNNDNLTSFYKGNYKKYIALAKRQTHGCYQDAQDVVSDALLRAVKYENSFNPAYSSFETWFNGIFRNTLRDYKKVRQKEFETFSREDWENVILEEGLKDEVRVLIYNTDFKKESHKHVVELFYLKGYSCSEISQVKENMTVTNITTICSRFKSDLKKANIKLQEGIVDGS